MNNQKPPKQQKRRHNGKIPTKPEEIASTRICKTQHDAKVSIIAAEMSEAVRKSTANGPTGQLWACTIVLPQILPR